MVSALVDTTILVDLLRAYSPAAEWIGAQTEGELGITPVVWMELVAGAQNKVAQRQAAQLLAHFVMVYYTQEDMDWAMEQLLVRKLSHSVGIMDCLIASASYRLQLPLYTQDLRHFTLLLGSLAQSPYQ